MCSNYFIYLFPIIRLRQPVKFSHFQFHLYERLRQHVISNMEIDMDCNITCNITCNIPFNWKESCFRTSCCSCMRNIEIHRGRTLVLFPFSVTNVTMISAIFFVMFAILFDDLLSDNSRGGINGDIYKHIVTGVNEISSACFC